MSGDAAFIFCLGMDRIRLVTLDMVGTVIRFSQPPVSQYQRVAARSVLRLDDSNVNVHFVVMDMK